MRRRLFLATTAGAIAAPAIVRAQARPEIAKLGMGFGLDPVFAPHIVAMQKGWPREAGCAGIAPPSFPSGALWWMRIFRESAVSGCRGTCGAVTGRSRG